MIKKFLYLLALASAAIAIPVIQTGCVQHTTLEAGGAYTDANLAKTDQAILDASRALTGFISWYEANKVLLDAKYPQVGSLAAKVGLEKDGWIRASYIARDSYASAVQAYNDALSVGKAGPAPDKAKLDAALAVLTNITEQISAFKSAQL